MSLDVIAVGVDGSEGTKAAIEWVAELAVRLGSGVVAIHSYEPLDHLGEVGPGTDFGDIKTGLIARARREWCRPLDEAGVSYVLHVEDGRPADVILKSALESAAGLIVVGARRLGWFQSLALGSTSRLLLEKSPVPVTVVHPTAD